MTSRPRLVDDCGSRSKSDDPLPKTGAKAGRFAASRLATVADPPAQWFSVFVTAVKGDGLGDVFAVFVIVVTETKRGFGVVGIEIDGAPPASKLCLPRLTVAIWRNWARRQGTVTILVALPATTVAGRVA